MLSNISRLFVLSSRRKKTYKQKTITNKTTTHTTFKSYTRGCSTRDKKIVKACDFKLFIYFLNRTLDKTAKKLRFLKKSTYRLLKSVFFSFRIAFFHYADFKFRLYPYIQIFPDE